MAAPIQKIARLAFHVFSRKQYDGTFLEGLKSLQVMLNNITSKDLNIDVNNLKSPNPEEEAPVAYLPIWEDHVISIGVFVVKPHGRLPLHDHPGMHGLIRVIHGSLSLKSFSETQNFGALSDFDGKRARKLGERVVTAADDCCMLTPTEGNFHEIRPVNETAAFLDVLAPPYESASDCNYYREISVPGSEKQSNGIIYLTKIAPPADYWCESFDYSGPVIDSAQFHP